jgi:hypothetical protein
MPFHAAFVKLGNVRAKYTFAVRIIKRTVECLDSITYIAYSYETVL